MAGKFGSDRVQLVLWQVSVKVPLFKATNVNCTIEHTWYIALVVCNFTRHLRVLL